MNISNETVKAKLVDGFRNLFGKEPSGFAEAPGRVELLGNHTDHQRGKVLAASVDLKAYAAFVPNGTDNVNIVSEGHSGARVNIKELMPDVSEFNSETSIVRGVLRGFYNLAKESNAKKTPLSSFDVSDAKESPLSGFDAYVISEVLTGSGLSSSAAYEVLLGRILNELFFDNKVSAVQIAKIGQFAENKFFGKPCGLMDQAASSVGDVVFFDFEDPKEPSVTQIPFDFQKAGYALCAVACGGGHADLTGDYASIPQDMCAVAKLFGKEVLREVEEPELKARKEEIISAIGERPYLRAVHFFEETRRAEEAAIALQNKDMPAFLALANQSGISSRTQLANIIPASNPSENKLDLAMRIAVEALGGKKLDGTAGPGMNGAVRMNGGGFSGTFLSIVPLEMLEGFKTTIEDKLGKGSCILLNT